MTGADLVLGIDVGGTRTKFGIVDPARRTLIAQVVQPTCTDGLEPYLRSLDAGYDETCARAGVPRSRVQGCGVGLPGFVGERISALWKPLAFLEGDHFLPALAKRLRVPVRADNDARLVALGEAAFGGHGKCERLLSLTIGSGIGFGFVVDHRLQEPTSLNHLAGHIPVRPVTERCYCGFNGCLEMLVNAAGLVRSYGGGAGAADVFEAAASNDPAGLRAVRQWLSDLSSGLNAYIYLFAPDIIVIGGGLSKGLAPMLDELKRLVFAMPREGYEVELAISRLQEQAGVLGAAAQFLG